MEERRRRLASEFKQVLDAGSDFTWLIGEASSIFTLVAPNGQIAKLSLERTFCCTRLGLLAPYDQIVTTLPNALEPVSNAF